MKRQDYVFGSTSDNVEEQSTSALNNGWAELSILYSRVLNGVCAALSQSTNTVSQEVANAIAGMGVTLNESDSSQLLKVLQTLAIKASDFQTPITADNKGATMKEIEDVVTSSLTFKGFVSTTQPSSNLEVGNLWINASSMPTTIPIASALIKEWNGTSWVAYGSTYTPANFDFFRNNNDNEGYYWFAGQWKVMSTDLSTEYFTLNQTSGKWEIKNSVNLPGTPTVNTPSATNTRAIVNVDFVKNNTISSGNFTNCITEIPQDIEYTLVDGTLKVLAGSIFYFPNGEGVFNKKTLSSDLSLTGPAINGSGSMMIFIDENGTGLQARAEPKCSSGTANPGVTHSAWWDTTNNVINNYASDVSTPSKKLSLPILILNVNLENSVYTITEVTKVFNGFGYMGSTLFSLPGVKGLIPDGRDEDGRMKNIAISSTSVKVTSITSAFSANLVLNQYATVGTYSVMIYDSDKNINYNSANPIIQRAIVGRATFGSGGKVTSFEIDPVFHATNYSDFERLTETVSENNNAAVHKTGDETISGIKTFTSSIHMKKTGLSVYNNNATKGTNPTSTQYWAGILWNDKTDGATSWQNSRLGYLEMSMSTAGATQLAIGTYKNEANSTASSVITIGYSLTSGAWATAPTPPANSNNTNIATTAWANAKFLPLAGGTLTGTITFNGATLAKRNVNNSYLELFGGTTYLNGAYLRLDGKDSSGRQGQFTLATGDGSSSKILLGRPDGTLQWNSINMSAITMPSGTYTDLTLGASSTLYTAPADGWYVVRIKSMSDGTHLLARNESNGVMNYSVSPYNSGLTTALIPVVSGQKVMVQYTSGTKDTFRFVYAEGSKYLKA